MTIKFYNSLTNQKEDFVPIREGEVGMYVCGMTVYDHCHLGHAMAMMAFDILARYLRYQGYKVNFIRNITDIDDKIIERANENNEKIDCDCICVSGFWTPTVHLASQSGNKLKFNDQIDAFVPDKSKQNETSIGASKGTFTLKETLFCSDIDKNLSASSIIAVIGFSMKTCLLLLRHFSAILK